MKRTILCVLIAAAGLAKDAEVSRKPACKAAIHGQFLPDAANTDAAAAGKLARCGSLEICAATGWRYEWMPVSVNVRQLEKLPREPTPACAAVMEEFTEKDR